MKQLVAAGIIEFSSEGIMASTCKTFVVSAILLAYLSLTLAAVKQNINVSKNFEKHANYDIQQFPREKRQEDIENFSKETDNSVKLEDKFLESQTDTNRLHDKDIIAEAIDQTTKRKDEEREEQDAFHTNNDTERNVEDDVLSYKNMHDLIQAFILADKENISDNLQLQKIENSTGSETHNNLPKRHVTATSAATATATATATNGLLGANLWDVIPLDNLDAHSCGVEAFEYGHVHVSGAIIHEFFCELRKLWHYILIVSRNLKSELSLGPLLTAEDAVGNSCNSIFGHFFHHGPQFLRTIIREPHHLLILPEIIRDAVPFHSIISAVHRFGHIFFRLVHFAHELLCGHVGRILEHLLFHNHLHAHLREKLLEIHPANLHYLEGLRSILPVEKMITEPIMSTSSATASVTTTADTYQDNSVVVPDYYKSLAEVLTSFRSAYDGYHASGIPHLIRTGAESFPSTTAISTIKSYLSRTPLQSYFGWKPILNTDTVGSSSSASASVSTSVSSPQGSAISPIVPIVPVESEVISSSASASTADIITTETQPIVSPISIPQVLSYIPLIKSTPTLSPVIVSDTIKNTVSESSSSSVAVTAPEIVVPNTLGNAGIAVSSTSSVAPSPISPLILRRYRPRPILPTITPTAASISSSVASSSVAASASASEGFSSSSSSASAVSPSLNGLNLVFPREKIVNALGYDCLLPGDIVTVTLRNKSTLFGRIFDATSPINFDFFRPKLHASIIRNGRRVWNLLPRDFRDPECIQKLNNPQLLRHIF